VSKVIWQEAASPTCHPSRLQMDSSDINSNRIYGSLDPCESTHHLKRHLDRLIRFSTAHPYAKHTDTQPTLRATYVAIGRISGDKNWPTLVFQIYLGNDALTRDSRLF